MSSVGVTREMFNKLLRRLAAVFKSAPDRRPAGQADQELGQEREPARAVQPMQPGWWRDLKINLETGERDKS
jgi:hypothetical protein